MLKLLSINAYYISRSHMSGKSDLINFSLFHPLCSELDMYFFQFFGYFQPFSIIGSSNLVPFQNCVLYREWQVNRARTTKQLLFITEIFATVQTLFILLFFTFLSYFPTSFFVRTPCFTISLPATQTNINRSPNLNGVRWQYRDVQQRY